MFKENKYCYTAFFVLLFLGFLSVLIFVILEAISKPDETKCNNPSLLNADQLQIDNQIAHFMNRTFPKKGLQKVNETHFSTCLENKVPVLRKCCPKNQILSFKKNPTFCDSGENPFDTELKVHDENQLPLPQYNLSHFHREYGMISCRNKKYLLISQNDTFTFYSDGTLLIINKNNLHSVENSDKFCLDMLKDDGGLILVAFVCFPPKIEDQGHLKLYPYGMIISTPFLFVIFLAHALLKELRATLHGLFVMSHTASLLIFYIFLAITQINGKGLDEIFCKICGFTVQFSFLAAFFWLNIMSADMWWSIKNLRHVGRGTTMTKKEIRKFLFCSLYGWGGPGIILCISLLMDLHPNIPKEFSKPHVGETMCLIDTDVNKLSALCYLYGPMGIIIVSNIYFFISTAIKISIIKKETQFLDDENECSSSKQKSNEFTVYLKLFVVMGVTWLLELLSWAIGGPKWIWYIPDFSNSLQGLYIFMIFFPKVKEEVLKKFRQGRSRNNSATKTSSVSKNSLVSSANYHKRNDEVTINSFKGINASEKCIKCKQPISLLNPI